MNGSRSLAVLIVLVLAFSSGCGVGQGGGTAVGEPMPGFDLPSLTGGRVASDDLRDEGKDRPLVLNFWATWCGPCVREIPTLNQLHRDGAARVVSISLDDGDEDLVRAFAESQGIEYPVLLGDGGTFRNFGGAVIPYTIVTDADLVVRDVHRGLVSRRALDRSLAKASDAG